MAWLCGFVHDTRECAYESAQSPQSSSAAREQDVALFLRATGSGFLRNFGEQTYYDADVRVVPVESWSHFDAMMAPGGEYDSWIFRGQGNVKWPILSSLSRHLQDFQVHQSVWPEQEARILRIFKRKAHLHLSNVPDDDDDFQWLAIVQHYGGPTRLLDFTWSPYVAAFFALEAATADAAVFALDTRPLKYELPAVEVDGTRRTFGSVGDIGAYRAVFLDGTRDIIDHADPAVLNQRITAQLGTFLVPGSLEKSVETIIDGLYEESPLVKFILPQTIRRLAMRSLHNRNVHNASLFPDLNGLAASLRYELEFHWAFNPNTGEDYAGYSGNRYARNRNTSHHG